MNEKKKGNKDIGCAVSAARWFLTTQVSKREFIIVRLSAGERAMMIQLETTVLCAIEHRNGWKTHYLRIAWQQLSLLQCPKNFGRYKLIRPHKLPKKIDNQTVTARPKNHGTKMCRPEITFWKPRPEKNSDPSSRTRLVATDADFPSPFFPLIQNCEKQLDVVFISRGWCRCRRQNICWRMLGRIAITLVFQLALLSC